MTPLGPAYSANSAQASNQQKYVYADDHGVVRGTPDENRGKIALYMQYDRDGTYLGWGEGEYSLQHYGPCGRYTQNGMPATQPLAFQRERVDSATSMRPEPMGTYGQLSQPTHPELTLVPDPTSRMMSSWDSRIPMGLPQPMKTYGHASQSAHTQLTLEPDFTSFDAIFKDVLPQPFTDMANCPQQTTQPAFPSQVMERAQHPMIPSDEYGVVIYDQQPIEALGHYPQPAAFPSQMIERVQHPNISSDDYGVGFHIQQPIEALGHYPQPASYSVDANPQVCLNWLGSLQAELRTGALPSSASGMLHMRLQTVHTEFMNTAEAPTRSRKRASEEAVDPKPSKRRARSARVSKGVPGSSKSPLPAAARIVPAVQVPSNDDLSGFEAFFDFSDASNPVMGSQTKTADESKVEAELDAELVAELEAVLNGFPSDPVSLEPMPEEHLGTESRPTSDSVQFRHDTMIILP